VASSTARGFGNRGYAHIIFSDDHGKTWQIGGIEEEKTNESTITELTDGSLLHNMRSYQREAPPRRCHQQRWWNKLVVG
jgi:sialidase-1